jgi:hypothetical protein
MARSDVAPAACGSATMGASSAARASARAWTAAVPGGAGADAIKLVNEHQSKFTIRSGRSTTRTAAFAKAHDSRIEGPDNATA